MFLDDPPGYYLAMRDAYRAGLLPPIVVTDSEIIDGYHRIVLALADKSPTIAAYQPEPCRSLAACAGTAGEPQPPHCDDVPAAPRYSGHEGCPARST